MFFSMICAVRDSCFVTHNLNLNEASGAICRCCLTASRICCLVWLGFFGAVPLFQHAIGSILQNHHISAAPTQEITVLIVLNLAAGFVVFLLCSRWFRIIITAAKNQCHGLVAPWPSWLLSLLRCRRSTVDLSAVWILRLVNAIHLTVPSAKSL